MEPVTLETDRLILRPFTTDDEAALFEASQDRDIQFYTPSPVPFRRSDAEKRVREDIPNGWATDKAYLLGGFRKDNNALVGSYCLFVVSPGVWELGYWTAKEQRGLGFAVEASRALCDWGWRTIDMHRIEWWAMVGNTGSRLVAERLGFTMEGTLFQRTITNDGKPHDWWVGGLLRPS